MIIGRTESYAAEETVTHAAKTDGFEAAEKTAHVVKRVYISVLVESGVNKAILFIYFSTACRIMQAILYVEGKVGSRHIEREVEENVELKSFRWED